MVWNPAQDFLRGMEAGQRAKARRRQEREREALRKAWGSVARSFGLDASDDDVENAFSGQLPDAAEVVEADVIDSFGEGYAFKGFEPAEDGQASAIRIAGPDGEEQLIGVDTEQGRSLITLPNDQSTGMPGSAAIETIMQYNPEAGLRLIENLRARRRARARNSLYADHLEAQLGLDQPAPNPEVPEGPRRSLVDAGSVGQGGAPSLDAAMRMDRNTPVAVAQPADPMPEVPEGQSLGEMPAVSPTMAPAAPAPSARRANFDGLDAGRAAFVQSVYPQAQRVAAELNVPVEAIIAQAALETGWGQSAPGNNYFGIKAPDGQGQGLRTAEYADGQRQEVTDNFRTYGDMGGSFEDLGAVLSQERYADARGAQSVREYADALQAGGYATDPEYANKVSAVADTIRAGMTLPQRDRTGEGTQTPSRLPPEEVLQRAGRDLSSATPGRVGELIGDAARSTGETLAGWAGDTVSLWNEYGQPIVDNSVAAYRDLGAGLTRGLTGREASPPEAEIQQSDTEADGPRASSSAQGGGGADEVAPNEEGGQMARFSLPTRRQIDRTRAQAQRAIRQGKASRDFGRKVVDSLRRGEISAEFAKSLMDSGDQYETVTADGQLWAVNKNNPRDAFQINRTQAEQLSAAEQWKRRNDTLEVVSKNMYPDDPRGQAHVRSQMLISDSSNLLDLNNTGASEALAYNAIRMTEGLVKDSGFAWFDGDVRDYPSLTPAIVALKAGYSPREGKKAREEFLNPLNAAAGRNLTDQELAILGDEIARNIGIIEGASREVVIEQFATLIRNNGIDAVIQRLREE